MDKRTKKMMYEFFETLTDNFEYCLSNFDEKYKMLYSDCFDIIEKLLDIEESVTSFVMTRFYVLFRKLCRYESAYAIVMATRKYNGQNIDVPDIKDIKSTDYLDLKKQLSNIERVLKPCFGENEFEKLIKTSNEYRTYCIRATFYSAFEFFQQIDKLEI